MFWPAKNFCLIAKEVSLTEYKVSKKFRKSNSQNDQTKLYEQMLTLITIMLMMLSVMETKLYFQNIQTTY